LAAKLTWQGCKSGKQASIQTIACLVCEDPTKQTQIARDCEQDRIFRRDRQREARQCPRVNQMSQVFQVYLYVGVPLVYRQCRNSRFAVFCAGATS
jgi:hypothetical protein